ncbi:hypothetical protein J3R30DRAFT_3560508 [Lentinula aciculospora]|uniref:Uncharacterized protein n=1 Tax=Lentinula aciculospora TaxID=153920 RepID=A0A9W8ZWN9_9AGAR|nr:hypothetical protein J3R30DRAFT_3560508 [Lentinula aciculospora]
MVDPDFVFSHASQNQCTPALSPANSRSEAMASFSPYDIQDHSTPHMKTRVAVRDRTPHRFQVIPLKDAKQSSSVSQVPKQSTPLSNARKGLKDVTNFQDTTPRGSPMVAMGKRSCLDIKREYKLPSPRLIKDTQPQSVLDHQAFLKPETPPVSPLSHLELHSKCSLPTPCVTVRPLNIVKRSRCGNGSGPSLTKLRPPTVQRLIAQDASNPHTTVIIPTTTTASASTIPTFDFLNSPAESTLTLSKSRRRSRSSNALLTSKLPTSSVHTRLNSKQSEVDESPKSFTTVSNPTTPTICQQRGISSTTNTALGPPYLGTKDAVCAPSASLTSVSEGIQMTSRFLKWRRTSKFKYLDSPSTTSTTSPTKTLESCIPSTKPKAPFHSRTLNLAMLKPRHGIAHSVDIVLNPRFLQAPQTRQYQDVRNVFSQYDGLLKTEIATSRKSVEAIPSTLPRRRSTHKSKIPSKRHAIYTQSLYVGKAEKDSNDYLRALSEGTVCPTSLRRAQNPAPVPADYEDTSAPSHSLESILQVYRDAVKQEGLHSRSYSMGLPTSHSEPTLHDISSRSLAVAYTGVAPFRETRPKPPEGSVSSSSLASIYSQDSWVSGSTQSDTTATFSEPKIGHKRGHHPIVWELLEKLESAQRTWVWDAGLDMF